MKLDKSGKPTVKSWIYEIVEAADYANEARKALDHG
jgi:hypothetical protein